MLKAVLRLRRLACGLSMLLAATAVEGSTVIYRTDAELVTLSDRVIHGRVIRQRVERPGGPDGAIYTVSTLAVLEDFTGAAGTEVEVWELGGTFAGETMWVGGAVTYEIGSTVLVCLERGRFGLRSVAMNFSTFTVEPTATADGSLDGRLRRNVGDTSVVGAPARRPADLTLAEFRDLTARIRNVTPRRNRSAALLEEEGSVQAGFTFLGPYRWTEADSGTPVTWYLNTSAPAPLTSGNGVAELQTALQAWTAPNTATIVLQYGGTTNQADADGPWGGIASTGTGVVTFEDPNNEISGSTLAIGGGFAFTTPGTGGTVNGTAFGKFTRGYIIWQNAAVLPASFKESTDFARVMEHEIGHTIGLGHSDMGSSNIMHPSCCTNGSTPTAPALGPDDLAALNFIYPASTPAVCTYSISPTSATAAATGGTGSVTVTAAAGCAWSSSVTSGGTFLAIGTGTSGSGNGTVGYSVAANNTTAGRSGTLSIAGNTFTVTQPGCSICAPTVTLHPSSVSQRPAWTASFSAAASGTPSPAVQWQESANGGASWSNIAGANSGTYSFIVTRAAHGHQFRAIFSNSGGSVATNPAVLLVIVTRQVASDLDGDLRTDLVVWRPTDGTWYVAQSSTSYTTGTSTPLGSGAAGDVPLLADFDGDGQRDYATWRASTGDWVWRTSSTNYTSGDTRRWGGPGDVPLLADLDGDSLADITVWRPSTGEWFWLKSSTNYTVGDTRQWGGAGDVPLLADLDGDGQADITVWRPSTGDWFWLKSTNNWFAADTRRWGGQGDQPLLGDFDGDGRADITVFRQSTGQWFWLTSGSGYGSGFVTTWGGQGDVPLLADFDGDARADITVWRPSSGQWFWLTSGSAYTAGFARAWGSGSVGDVPVIK